MRRSSRNIESGFARHSSADPSSELGSADFGGLSRAELAAVRVLTSPRPGFTLLELMVTIAIIGILASTLLFALFSAQETAKEAKTRSLITKLNSVVMPKWESYRTRRVPIIVYPPTTSDSNYLTLNKTFVYEAARARLDALHEIMRLELPDEWIDITTGPQARTYTPAFSSGQSTIGPLPRPAISQAYLNAYNSAATPPTNQFQSAECLYLIVTLGVTDNLGGRELFNESNIGDVDNDGFKEFLDGWGRPIGFVRWPAGFPSELGRQATSSVSSGSGTNLAGTATLSANDGTYVGAAVMFTSGTLAGQAFTISGYTGASRAFTLSQSMSGSPNPGDTFNVMDPDPFDARHIYPTGAMPNGSQPTSPAAQPDPTFAIFPLIYSSGPDKIPDIVTTPYNTDNNPFARTYTTPSGGLVPIGAQQDLANDSDPPNGIDNSKDNIHNHLIGTR